MPPWEMHILGKQPNGRTALGCVGCFLSCGVGPAGWPCQMCSQLCPLVSLSDSFSCPAVPIWGWNTLSCCSPLSSVLLGPWCAVSCWHSPCPAVIVRKIIWKSVLVFWVFWWFFFFFSRQMMLNVSQFANWLDNSYCLFLVKVLECNLGANIHRQTNTYQDFKTQPIFPNSPRSFLHLFPVPHPFINSSSWI